MMVVRHSMTVFQNTLLFFKVLNRPQKQRASTATMKNAAPVLYGRPRVFTKNRSMYAASLGSQGMIRKRMTASITTDTANIFTSSQALYLPSSRFL